MKVIDPIKFQKMCWPHIHLYDKQKEILYSVRDNFETVVPAGNKLGKDFVAALCVLWFFVSRHPCRIVTTSVDGTQLAAVLWGEIRRFVQESEIDLPIIDNHLHLRKKVKDRADGLSYVIGRVAAKGEGMLGHHIAKSFDGVPKTLFVADEASGVDDISYERADTWADRKLIIGNPYPTTNFFYRGVKEGDLESKRPGHYHRKVIKIRAEDSPNVRLGLAQEKKEKEPSDEILIPGVISHSEYTQRREMWDEVRQCIGLDGEFYEGASVLMFPPEWLNRAERIAEKLEGKRRYAKTIGVDPAQGGDDTCWSVVDELGLIEQIAISTPDTSVITGNTIALMKRYDVKAENVLFDAGGGGKEHADRMRRQGYQVRTVAFGGGVTPPIQRGVKVFEKRELEQEDRYIYKNRRAEMYGILRNLLDPGGGSEDHSRISSGFGIPAQNSDLRRQLSPIPLIYDAEGRMELLPKNKPNAQSKKLTLHELIGRSPDHADSLVLATFGLTRAESPQIAGTISV